jgi:hypothetical protein
LTKTESDDGAYKTLFLWMLNISENRRFDLSPLVFDAISTMKNKKVENINFSELGEELNKPIGTVSKIKKQYEKGN